MAQFYIRVDNVDDKVYQKWRHNGPDLEMWARRYNVVWDGFDEEGRPCFECTVGKLVDTICALVDLMPNNALIIESE